MSKIGSISLQQLFPQKRLDNPPGGEPPHPKRHKFLNCYLPILATTIATLVGLTSIKNTHQKNEPDKNEIEIAKLQAQLAVAQRYSNEMDERILVGDPNRFISFDEWQKSGYPRINPNTKDANGRPLLFIAAERSLTDVVQDLLNRGADVNAKIPSSQETALHAACTLSDPTIARLLLDRGASTGAKDSEGLTPLYTAVDENHSPIVKLLVERGANVDIHKQNHVTPLMMAAYRGEPDIFQLLLNHGADIGATTPYDYHPNVLAFSFLSDSQKGAIPSKFSQNILEAMKVRLGKQKAAQLLQKANSAISLVKSHRNQLAMHLLGLNNRATIPEPLGKLLNTLGPSMLSAYYERNWDGLTLQEIRDFLKTDPRIKRESAFLAKQNAYELKEDGTHGPLTSEHSSITTHQLSTLRFSDLQWIRTHKFLIAVVDPDRVPRGGYPGMPEGMHLYDALIREGGAGVWGYFKPSLNTAVIPRHPAGRASGYVIPHEYAHDRKSKKIGPDQYVDTSADDPELKALYERYRLFIEVVPDVIFDTEAETNPAEFYACLFDAYRSSLESRLNLRLRFRPGYDYARRHFGGE